MPSTSQERKRFNRRQRHKRRREVGSSNPTTLLRDASKRVDGACTGATHYFSWSVDMPDGNTLWAQEIVRDCPEMRDKLQLHLFLQTFVRRYQSVHGGIAAAKLGIPFVFMAAESIAAANGRELVWEKLDISACFAVADTAGVCEGARPLMLNTLLALYRHLLDEALITAEQCASVTRDIHCALSKHQSAASLACA